MAKIPPYTDITGIVSMDDKHQKISKVEYDGLARPGQIIVDTTDYSVWVGNSVGNLNPVVGSGGVAVSIAGANVTGEVNFAAVANSVAAANVVGKVANAAYADTAGALDAAGASAVKVGGGLAGQVLKSDGAGNMTWEDDDSLPAAPLTSVQFNDGGVFGGDSTFTFDKATGELTVTDLKITGNVKTSLLPDADITYDLGSSAQRWNDLWLANTTIHLGDKSISSSAGNVTFSGNLKATQLFGAANTVSDSAQPNITSVGTLVSLEVTGNADIGNVNTDRIIASGNVTIAGNLTVSGDTTQINVTELTIEDPIISMGGGANGANATTYDAKDRGLLLQDYYPDGSGVNNHFFGWVSSAAQFEAIANVTDSSTGVIAGTAGNIAASWFVGDLDGNATYANSAGTVTRDNVTGAGNIGQLQWADAAGNLTSNERYYIAYSGTAAINASRDTPGAGFQGAVYTNTVAYTTFSGLRARGSKAAPLPVQIGDRVTSALGFPYTGNGTATLDTVTGFVTAQGAGFATTVTSLPTSAGATPGMSVNLIATASASNSMISASFTENGNFTIPGSFVGSGASLTGLVSTKDLAVTGNVTTALLPGANITYDLGSPTQRWKDIYLSNNTIYMGDQTISANATHVNLTGTVNASVFEGVLGNGTSNVSISAADGNIDFVVGGTQQWAMGTGGALTAANTIASISGATDQTLSIRSGSLEIGTADNLVPDGTVNDFRFVGGNGGAGDAAGHGGNLVMSTGVGGLGLNGNDGAPGGAFTVLTGLGGQCDAGATPGTSGEIHMETAPALDAVGAPGPSSGPITIVTGDGGASDVDQGGNSGTISLTTGKGGNGNTNGWAGEAGGIILTTGNGGDIPDNSRGAEQGGPIEIRSGDGGNGRNGGRGGDIEVVAGNGGTGTTSNGGRGGEILLRSGTGSATSGDQPGGGGLIEIIAGNGGEGITDFGGNADGVEIKTGNGGDGVDASGVNHGGGDPWGDGGPFRLKTGAGGTVQQGEAGYGGNIEFTTGVGGNTGTSGSGTGGNAGNMSVILGTGGESNDGTGGAGGSFTFTAGVGGQGTSGGGIGGSLTLTAGAGGSGGSTTGDGGNITLITAGGQAKLDAVGDFTVTSNVNAKNFNANINGALTFPMNATRLSENVRGDEVNVVVPLTTVTGGGSGGSVEVRYYPGNATYTRAWAQNDGSGYTDGDQVMVPGSLLGGVDGTNDLFMTLVTVSGGTVGSGEQTLDSGIPVSGPAGFNLETDGDNWSFSNRKLTVPGDIQSEGYDDLKIICRDIDDDGLEMSIRYVDGSNAVKTEIALDDNNIVVEARGPSGTHRWSFGDSGELQMTNDTGVIVSESYPITVLSRKSSTSAAGDDASLVSQWNNGGGGGVATWTAVTAGFRGATITTNMGDTVAQGADALAKAWTFTDNGVLELPEVNNEKSSMVGSRTTVQPTATVVTAPTATPTLLYTPTAGVASYKIVISITHDTGGTKDTEIFEVFAANGNGGTFFTVSNRINTYGSGVGGANDTVVTIDGSFAVNVETQYGTTNTVTFSVTEFMI